MLRRIGFAKRFGVDESLTRGECGTWLAVPFFVSYTIVTSFVVLKMIVALIIDNFVISLKQDGSRIQHRHTEAFVRAWGEHDPYGTGQMSLAHLFDVIQSLPPPLGLDPAHFPNNKVRDVDLSRFILSLGLVAHMPSYPSPDAAHAVPLVSFHEVLNRLLNAAFGDVLHSMRLSSTSAEMLQVVERSMKDKLRAKQTAAERLDDENFQYTPAMRHAYTQAFAIALERMAQREDGTEVPQWVRAWLAPSL